MGGMSPPAVTVVIPTRNRATLLSCAIASALAQTFEDLEVLVIDDASDDETPRVAASVSDSRVRWHRLALRSGGGAARNCGIARARGEFVAFLDDDDEWMADKLEAQIALFGAGTPRLGVVYSSYVVVDRETGRVLGRKAAHHRGDLSSVLVARNVVGGTSSVVVRRSCFDRVGCFDETLPSFQDYDLWIRLSREFDFDCVDRDLLKYYVHARKIWSDPDALDRGIDIMSDKYFDSRPLRRNLSSQSLRVGAQFCAAGAMARGRAAFRRSMRLNPMAPRAYANYGLSFFGSETFGVAHRLWQRMLRPRAPEGTAPPASAERFPREAGR
jgi:glycosyltransferase involved in cell wall biosynthesis